MKASSATVYGPSWINLSRVPAKRSRRSHGLRSAGHPDGWYSSGVKAIRRKPTVGANGLVEPMAGPESDDVVLRAFIRTDYASERRAAGTIRMGDLD
jgi:hypothetical protein